MKRRIVSFMLAILLLISTANLNVYAYKAAYKLPTLTGNEAKDTAAIAKSQLGYTESGGTVYGKWWSSVAGGNYTYASWCGMFASWCANKAGAGLGVGFDKYSAKANSLFSFLKENGSYNTSFSKSPKAGDFIFFGTSGGTAQHVAIVTDYNSSTKTVMFVGGNQGEGEVKKGTCKYAKGVKWGSQYVIGYGRPDYEDNSLKITSQPESAIVEKGDIAKVKVGAKGLGLTYKWYFKNKGDSKFSYTSTFKGATYTAEMNESRAGRQVYCVITDKYGNSVQTKTVTIKMGVFAKITSQPENVTVPTGMKAGTSLEAKGDGLTYKWYYKNKGEDSFTYTGTFKGPDYSVVMNESRAGRQIYCVVTDKYGNSEKSSTVTLGMGKTLKITNQPKNVTVAKGEAAETMVNASGDGLTYKWYFKNAGIEKFQYTAAYTGKSYSVTMNESRAGRQIYCVIEDKYGKTVKTDTVTLNMK